MGGGDEETDEGWDDDGDETDWLLPEGHYRIGYWYGVGEESDGDDQVEASPDLVERRVFLLLYVAIHRYRVYINYKGI